MSKVVKLLFGALGNATRPALPIFEANKDFYLKNYGVEFHIEGVCDSKGAVIKPDMGFMEVEKYKEDYGSVSKVPQFGHPGMTAQEMIQAVDADIYIEALPPNLPTGEPGTTNIITALDRNMHVVTANKAPLALYWKETVWYAKKKGLQLLYGTAASAGLNSLQLEKFLGGCDDIVSFDGIFNASCMCIFKEMKAGKSFDEAVDFAKKLGTLDPNPDSDLDGWDSAMKCVIHANNIWDAGETLDQVKRTGIKHITKEMIEEATAAGENWCIISHADKDAGGNINMWVAPKKYPADSPIGRNTWNDKVILLKSKSQEDQLVYGMNNAATCTPGNIVLDVVTIARSL
ncbi:MAG: hypothetical protein MJ092_00485 [Lachnospiraceae bacterium]|nr:hypothetical protein [Lachnospiraceae bacterium]